jgi:hypothetical protein
MTQRRLLLGLFLAAGLTGWLIARPGKATPAGSDPAPPREVVAADYAENGEEAAAHRWATNQARHWRHLMVQR